VHYITEYTLSNLVLSTASMNNEAAAACLTWYSRLDPNGHFIHTSQCHKMTHFSMNRQLTERSQTAHRNISLPETGRLLLGRRTVR
jgi:hypothetical protein